MTLGLVECCDPHITGSKGSSKSVLYTEVCVEEEKRVVESEIKGKLHNHVI